jgi:hypothetical protein
MHPILRAVLLFAGAVAGCFAVILGSTVAIAKLVGGSVAGGWRRALELLVYIVLVLQVLAQVGRTAAPGLPAFVAGLFEALAALQFDDASMPAACWRGYPFRADVAQMGAALALSAALWALLLVPQHCTRQQPQAPTRRPRSRRATHVSATASRWVQLLNQGVRRANFGSLFTTACFTLSSLLYSTVANSVFKVLNCVTVEVSPLAYLGLDRDGSSADAAAAAPAGGAGGNAGSISVSVLASQSSFVCYEGSHRGAGILAWFTLTLVIAGYPLWSAAWASRHIRSRILLALAPPEEEADNADGTESAPAAVRSALGSGKLLAAARERGQALWLRLEATDAGAMSSLRARHPLRLPLLLAACGRERAVRWLSQPPQRSSAAAAVAGRRQSVLARLRTPWQREREEDEDQRRQSRRQLGDQRVMGTPEAAVQQPAAGPGQLSTVETAAVGRFTFSPLATVSWKGGPKRAAKPLQPQRGNDVSSELPGGSATVPSTRRGSRGSVLTAGAPAALGTAPSGTAQPASDLSGKKAPPTADAKAAAEPPSPPLAGLRLVPGLLRAEALNTCPTVLQDARLGHFVGSTNRASLFYTRQLDLASIAALAAIQALWPPPTSESSVAGRGALNMLALAAVAWHSSTRNPFWPQDAWKLYVKVGSLLLAAVAVLLTHFTLAMQIRYDGDTDAQLAASDAFAADARTRSALSYVVFIGCVVLLGTLAVGFWTSSITSAHREQRQIVAEAAATAAAAAALAQKRTKGGLSAKDVLRAVNPLRVLAAGAPTDAAARATGAATAAASDGKHGPGSCGGSAGGRPPSRLMSARSGGNGDFASVVADALDARSTAAAAQSAHGRQRRGSGTGQPALGVYFAPVRSRSGGHGRGVGGVSGGGSARDSRRSIGSGGTSGSSAS